MKSIKFFLAIFISFFINSCSQFGDSLFLPGEDPEDIVLYELDNEYLAPESKEYISFVHSSKELNSSYILVGKKTYGFEANLNTNESLSFDEDGKLRLERDHPFLADKYKKGDIKNGSKDRDKGDKDRDKDDKDRDKDDKDWDREEKEKCFELVMPYTLIMPDASSITIETEEDREKVEHNKRLFTVSCLLCVLCACVRACGRACARACVGAPVRASAPPRPQEHAPAPPEMTYF